MKRINRILGMVVLLASLPLNCATRPSRALPSSDQQWAKTLDNIIKEIPKAEPVKATGAAEVEKVLLSLPAPEGSLIKQVFQMAENERENIKYLSELAKKNHKRSVAAWQKFAEDMKQQPLMLPAPDIKPIESQPSEDVSKALVPYVKIEIPTKSQDLLQDALRVLAAEGQSGIQQIINETKNDQKKSVWQEIEESYNRLALPAPEPVQPEKELTPSRALEEEQFVTRLNDSLVNRPPEQTARLITANREAARKVVAQEAVYQLALPAQQKEAIEKLGKAIDSGNTNLITNVIKSYKQNLKSAFDAFDAELHKVMLLPVPPRIATQQLFDALKFDDFKGVKNAIQAGADVNSADNETGMAPLHLAAQICDKDVVNALIAAKADINIENAKDYSRTPLYYVAITNVKKCPDSIDIAKKLIDLGAKIDKPDKNGTSPIDYIKDDKIKAMWQEHAEAYKHAIQAPAAPLLDALIKAIEERDYEKIQDAIKKVIDAHADINAKSEEGLTALHHAARTCDSWIIMQLLKQFHGTIDVNVQGAKHFYKETPLHVVASLGCKRPGELLVLYGAKLDQENARHETPISIIKDKFPHNADEIIKLWRDTALATAEVAERVALEQEADEAAQAKAITEKAKQEAIDLAKNRVKKAGIIPYFIDPQTGQVKLLISYGCTKFYDKKQPCSWKKVYSSDVFCKDKWTDFGGSVEEKDFAKYKNEAGKVCAIREFNEETIGYFLGLTIDEATKKDRIDAVIDSWKEKLDDNNKVKTQSGYQYWFVDVAYPKNEAQQIQDLKSRFDELSNKWSYIFSSQQWPCADGKGYMLLNPDSFIEKSDYRWVSAQTILDVTKGLTGVKDTDNITIQDPMNPTEKLELYYRFVNSMVDGRATLQRIVNEAKNQRPLAQFGALVRATQIGDVATVQKLLKEGVIPTALDNTGMAPIHYAAGLQNSDVLKAILDVQKDSDINVKTSQGSTPLFIAVRNRSLPNIKLLIDRGADVNMKSNKGLAPLHIAVYDEAFAPVSKSKCFVDAIEELLKAKTIDVNVQSDKKDDYKKTPLHYAAQFAHDVNCNKGAQALIKAGADLNKKDGNDQSPLDIINSQNWPAKKTIIEAWKNDSPLNQLIKAIKSYVTSNDLSKIKSALEVAAKVNVIDQYDDHGLTPLHYAANTCNKDILSEVLKYNPSLNKPETAGYARSPLHFVALNCDDPEIGALLIEHGADMNQKDESAVLGLFGKRTPLEYAEMRHGTSDFESKWNAARKVYEEKSKNSSLIFGQSKK